MTQEMAKIDPIKLFLDHGWQIVSDSNGFKTFRRHGKQGTMFVNDDGTWQLLDNKRTIIHSGPDLESLALYLGESTQ